MGLDMYAVALPAQKVQSQTDFKIDEDAMEVHYWRKHPNLHGFMHELYESKGGTGEDFNMDSVKIEDKDLDALETAIKEKSLPDTTGFFFGESDGSEIEDDLAFIAKARALISEGYTIAYYAWW